MESGPAAAGPIAVRATERRSLSGDPSARYFAADFLTSDFEIRDL